MTGPRQALTPLQTGRRLSNPTTRHPGSRYDRSARDRLRWPPLQPAGENRTKPDQAEPAQRPVCSLCGTSPDDGRAAKEENIRLSLWANDDSKTQQYFGGSVQHV